MTRLRSLQARLLVAMGVVAVAAVAAVALSVRTSTRQEFARFQDIERVRNTGELDRALDVAAAALDGRCCDAMPPAAPGHVLLVFDATGTLVAQAVPTGAPIGRLRGTYRDQVLNISAGSPADASRTSTGFTMVIKGGPVRQVRSATGTAMTLAILALPPPDGEAPAVVFLGSVDRRLVIIAVGVAIVALALTWIVTRRLTRPIAELSDATRDLAAGRLSRRVDATGTDDVAELAQSFNRMAAELERQETLRRHLVHDVAHELRTPLTALRCRVETVVDGLAADPRAAVAGLSDDIGHLSRLVEDLEELARAEARELGLTIAPVAIDEICRSAIRVAGLDGDPRVTFEGTPGSLPRVNADAVRARQILVNLLSNADRHTPAGGAITVRAHAEAGAVAVDVANTGSTLTVEAQARVFDRFYRVDPSRQRATGGSGLGLAIARHLAEAQQGRLSVTADPDRVCFTLTLPVAPAGSH